MDISVYTRPYKQAHGCYCSCGHGMVFFLDSRVVYVRHALDINMTTPFTYAIAIFWNMYSIVDAKYVWILYNDIDTSILSLY